MAVRENLKQIVAELSDYSVELDDKQAEAFLKNIQQAKHIFLAGAGRSGLAIRAFANRLLHLGFEVSLVGEISSPHSHPGDLLIICSGSGETGSLVELAKKAKKNKVAVTLVSMKEDSTIGQLATSTLILPGKLKDEGDIEGFSQPMGTAFEQLSFLTFDALVLDLMATLDEDSETMFARHADFE